MAKKTRRPLFTDGWNSAWHVIFGVLGGEFLLIIPIFVAYQLIDFHDVNLFIDLGEFVIGFLLYLIVIKPIFGPVSLGRRPGERLGNIREAVQVV